MKVVHALVGHLAVTALPFHWHSFAFASPLAAIYYDGYVNTTQNHTDSALMKRVPGDIIEARQVEFIPDALIVTALIASVYIDLLWIHEDDPVRGNDVEFIEEHFD